MGVPQWTTPTLVLTFTEETLDLTAASSVYVTFKTARETFTKTGESLTVTAKTISIYLEQYETGAMGEGSVQIQVNWIDANGNRFASDVATVQITQQLLNKVIE